MKKLTKDEKNKIICNFLDDIQKVCENHSDILNDNYGYTKARQYLEDSDLTELGNLQSFSTQDFVSFLFSELSDNDYFKSEFIYYSEAMEFLFENDVTLEDSTKLAVDMGLTLGTVNSCQLASILSEDIKTTQWNDYENELEENIEDLYTAVLENMSNN